MSQFRSSQTRAEMKALSIDRRLPLLSLGLALLAALGTASTLASLAHL